MEKDEIEVEVNPSGIATEYLRSLNSCFAHWGDRKNYAWAFERRAGSFNPDLMALRRGGELLAGSAVSYRKISLPNGQIADVGIMTGSWTLPAARGQGCFSRIIGESIRLAKEKNAALLLAFVTDTNASYRRLADAGAALFPTSYVVSDADMPRPATALKIHEIPDAEMFLKRMGNFTGVLRKNGIHFFYPDPDEWRSQFLQRPLTTEILDIEGFGWCVMEKADGVDRVLMLALENDTPEKMQECIEGLLQRSLTRGRNLFLFAASSEMQRCCSRLGLRIISGHLTALVADSDALRDALQMKESLSFSDSVRLADPHSPWFLGKWNIQSGDRM